MKDVIYPVFSSFDHDFVVERLQKHIDRKWNSIHDDEAKLLRLIDIFWFFRKTPTLLFVKERIEALESQPLDISKINFSVSNNSSQDSYLRVLELFGNTSDDDFQIALELLLNYVQKKPELTSQVLHILTNKFSFNRESHLRGYSVQKSLISKLINKAEEEPYSEFFGYIVLSVAPHYLSMQFRNDWTEKRGMQLVWAKFSLWPTTEVFELRKMLWMFLEKTWQKAEFKSHASKVVSTYSRYWRDVVVPEVAQSDSEVLLPFLTSFLDAKNYADCVLMQGYLRFLDRHELPYDESLKTSFQNDTYKVSKVLDDEDERMELGWEEYQNYKSNLLRSHFASYLLNEYKILLTQCEEITNTGDKERSWRSIEGSVLQVLINLSEANPSLFRETMAYVFQAGNQLGFSAWRLVYPIRANHKNRRAAFDFLNNCEYLHKDKFLLDLLGLIGREKAQKFYLDEIYKLYRRADFKYLQDGFDHLLSYQSLDKNVVVKVVAIIRKREDQENTPFNWSGLVDLYSETSKRLSELFAHEVDLIKTIYLSNLSNQDTDYQSKSFIQILDLDPNFIYEYINWMYSQHEYLSHHNDHRNYKFLWARNDYKDLMIGVIEHMFEKEGRAFWSGTYLSVFFGRHEGEVKELLEERKFELLKLYIERHSQDQNRMRYIFGLIANPFSLRRNELFAVFLKHNQKIEDFNALPMNPSSTSFTNSIVPVYEARIKNLESLLPLLSGNLALLPHRNSVEVQIEGWRRTIEDATKQEFIER